MAKNVANRIAENDEKGKGSVKRFPLRYDPPIKINGIPIIINAYHDNEQRHKRILERNCLIPLNPLTAIITVKAPIAGAYTARKKRGCCPVIWPNKCVAFSGSKIKKPSIPQAIPNVISRNGISVLKEII